MTTYYLAETEEDYLDAELLFREYAASLKINLDFQHFDDELTGLKKMYGMPDGGIILARDEAEIVGCVAIRRINIEEAELKRMFIKEANRKKGIGKILLQRAIMLARDCNYSVIKLDTLNYMHAAIHLYKDNGFYEIPAYYLNPIATAVYFEKKL